ncbi:nuclear transport factor 2 family protein [Streptomyces albogriseolus]|uniref:nuclear transport factor 2 family protein n=1 Tax=Streptomyces TaxID=1883 RepID=UPI002A765D5E|nr:nuclear transport factor 2 family protein [Streptomyces sp. CL7]WPP34385.1 nuclear transport factor 2 family protein [Streptomyces sp. CL7]
MTADLAGTVEHPFTRREFAALYAQAQRYYAHQMRILDAPDTESWAATFTEDAVLELPSLPGPVPAHAQLTHYAHARAARQRRAGGRLDHWVGMLDVRPQADGSLRTRCSALAYATPAGGGPRVLYVCVMEDVLVRTHGAWCTAHRRVIRDDLA